MRFWTSLIVSFFLCTVAVAQDGLYNPAYSNPYTSPMATPGNNNGNGNGNGPGSNNGNGNGNGNDGNQGNGWGNGGGKNGVPLDTEAWVLMIAGAAFGIWRVLDTRKPA
jgi:hypothetical protein